jgi:hypothetical protein
MAYSNSPLVTYKNITSHKNSPRNHEIDTITIHCYVGQVTAKRGCDYFVTTNRSVSANYVVGYDGSIGLSVPESDRAWTSGNRENDNRAVTIEVACDTFEPYRVTDKAYNALINLVADICKRNNIKELKWEASKALIGKIDRQNMTVHRWFDATACPGEYLFGKHSDIAKKLNQILSGDKKPTEQATTKPVQEDKNSAQTNSSAEKSQKLKAGTKLNLNNVPLFASAYIKNRAGVKSGIFYVWSDEIINNRIRITNKPEYVGKADKVTGYIAVTWAKTMIADDDIKVKILDDALNIRKGAGTQYDIVGQIKDHGIYTIVETKGTIGNSGSWGKLKSGAGWISLASCYVKQL